MVIVMAIDNIINHKVHCSCFNRQKPSKKRNKKTGLYHCLNCGHKIILLKQENLDETDIELNED